ncbi:MAG TPA: diaminopimelate epimerase [Bryobacteraceae bacterium]|nr:diaminopimelate epimerase [Bryobacteraceae bacterium]HWB95850.1 diaminopimelate epimerase [Bryobacteraceae bacterium]
MTRIPFFKLHGARNDFLLTWLEDAPTAPLPEIAAAICDRHAGVGADGWMLVDRASGDGFDASIRLFNSDGSEPEISGNGTRCAAALLAREDPSRREFRIRTGAGVKHLRLLSRQDEHFQFEMNMGVPRVVELHATVQGRDAVLMDVGNPQCVFPVDNFDFDWLSVGAATERDPRFPNRTNVSFVRLIDGNTIDVRFWERGAGHTNSSGTGSTGAAAAVLARGSIFSPVSIWTPAGTLVIRALDNVLFLTGPAEMIAEGTYAYPDLVPK